MKKPYCIQSRWVVPEVRSAGFAWILRSKRRFWHGWRRYTSLRDAEQALACLQGKERRSRRRFFGSIWIEYRMHPENPVPSGHDPLSRGALQGEPEGDPSSSRAGSHDGGVAGGGDG